jgi:hypothetical protein
VTLAGEMAPHVRPAGTLSVSATVPEKPPTAATVIVLEADTPAVVGTGLGAAVMLNVLPRLNTAFAVWLKDPLVPVTTIVKLPAADAVQDSDAVAGEGGSITLAGSVQVTPAGGVLKDKLTVPEKPLRLVTVTVEVPDSVAELAAEAAMLKSTMWKRMPAVVCDSVPSVPVTVTV